MLAHDARALGEGLSVYSDGWQSRRRVEENAEFVFEHVVDWIVAWRGLDICALGRHSWSSFDDQSSVAAAERAFAESRELGADFSVCDYMLGVFPCGESV